jgi:D-tyrosyl-tRNA(Tyr) deacylase
MKSVIQRVSKASVKVDQKIVGQIGQGLLLFLGVGEGDNQENITPLAKKIINLRIFENKDHKFDLSLLDIQGEILVIPQFTLFADCAKGNRPFFGEAARPKIAEPLFGKFVTELEKSGLKVEKGRFGAKMEIIAINDGPVTIILNN